MNPSWRIGQLAERVGVTPRTIRYYEEVGLMVAPARSSGGTRRYGDADLARLMRIRELQAVMGFNLEEIRELLAAGDRLEDLRIEYRAGATPGRTAAIVSEAIALNARTQEQVLAKIAVLQAYQHELQADGKRYRAFARRHGVDVSTRNV